MPTISPGRRRFTGALWSIFAISFIFIGAQAQAASWILAASGPPPVFVRSGIAFSGHFRTVWWKIVHPNPQPEKPKISMFLSKFSCPDHRFAELALASYDSNGDTLYHWDKPENVELEWATVVPESAVEAAELLACNAPDSSVLTPK